MSNPQLSDVEAKLTPPKRPLQWFRRGPEKHRDINTHLYMSAMNEVKRKMENGTAVSCTATYGLTKQEELGFNDIELAYALSAPWAAGIGTVSSTSISGDYRLNVMQTTTAFEIAICVYNPISQY